MHEIGSSRNKCQRAIKDVTRREKIRNEDTRNEAIKVIEVREKIRGSRWYGHMKRIKFT